MSAVKPSRRKLLQVDVDAPQVESMQDRRSETAQDLRKGHRETLTTIEEIFAGTDLPKDAIRVRTMLALRGEIIESWGQARDAFLHVGRSLNRIDETLHHEERERLREHSVRLFPFSDGIASQLRQVAAAVDEGRIPLQLLPGSYSVAYQLTLLKPAQLIIAHERGLVRPDVTRQALIQFRRETRDEHHGVSETTLSRARLRNELRRLEGERRRSLLSLASLRRRMREIQLILETRKEA